ncbi:MAG: 4Fe-4S binding protein [Eggerthellaceae bacterium]|jgi:NAD-dependent dihydropyrimidine dehydrogenase PreA subunit|nr:4Fe-4S binding protein [Eggerthellaceae bacterium]
MGTKTIQVNEAAPAGNVDERGQVTYLDADRLARKEKPDRPLFEPHPKGLGLKDRFWTRFSVRPWNYGAYAHAFHFLRNQLWRTAHPDTVGGKLVRNVLMMPNAQKGSSGGTVFNLNVDLSDKQGSVVVPIDLVKQAIDKADYIGGMNRCLCRTANKCEHYPADLGCLFLGKSGQAVVKHRIAREFTKEEAYARVDRAAELGLVCLSLWVEIEQIVWGLKNDEMTDMVEICFCCPCCCTALNLCKDTTPDVRARFTPSGFTATIDQDTCIGCKSCIDTRCPQDALHVGAGGKVTVDQEVCFGCGYCKGACPTGAIAIRQTMPMRAGMHEYMLKESRIDLAVDGYPGAHLP